MRAAEVIRSICDVRPVDIETREPGLHFAHRRRLPVCDPPIAASARPAAPNAPRIPITVGKSVV